MSRFYTASTSEESSSEEEEEVPEVTTRSAKQFTRVDSSDEDEQRVVKSKAQKFRDDAAVQASRIRNGMKVADWSSVEDSFSNMCKLLEKSKKQIAEVGVPISCLKIFVELQDEVKEAYRSRKKLNKQQGTSLNRIHSKLPKFLKTVFNRKPLETSVNEYRENPVEEEESEQEESEDEESEEEEEDDEKKSASKAPEESEDSDDSYWDTDTSDESDDEEAGERNEQRGFRGWVATDFLKSTTQAKKKQREGKEGSKPKPQAAKEGEGEEGDEGEEKEVTMVVQGKTKEEKPLFEKGEEITYDKVMNKFKELTSARNKRREKGAHRRALRRLRNISDDHGFGAFPACNILVALITSYFDEDISATGYMDIMKWALVHNLLVELIGLLLKNKDIVVSNSTTGNSKSNKSINVDVVRLVERLDDELTRSLRNIDQNSPDYIARLSDEVVLYNLIVLTQQYSRTLTADSQCRVRLLRLERIYYKRTFLAPTPRGPTRMLPSKVEHIMEKYDRQPKPEDIHFPVPSPWVVDNKVEADIEGLVDRLCKFVYKHCKGRMAVRTALCHVFHLALFDRWTEARDLMLMSRLQDTISQADIPTQILFNRAMVQLGLCAFRAGNVIQAQAALNEIVQMGRAKELLAQGYKFRHDKSQSQISKEKMRQTPFHMHINVGLLEAVYYTASMLIEIPAIAQYGTGRSRYMNRNFRHRLEEFCRESYHAPPETTREKIMSASLAMLQGDWVRCREFICDLGVWDLMPNKPAVLTMLAEKIQHEGLRTFLLANSGYFDSITLDKLAERFELDMKEVRGIVSKMIFRRELYAFYDPMTAAVVMYRQQPSSLQVAAKKLADKVGQLLDANDRLYAARFYSGPREGGQQQDNRRRPYNRYSHGQRGNQRYRGGGQGRQWNNRPPHTGARLRRTGPQ
ncbi:hypothetical protein PTSG_08410 [Salpingoeca rosetta]|uniref:PCI domain-containing protein n=1 Tax=Salpingoeca rosetta (strain ATCC 50818 / BSB-021) TaxID=946362 RepID=F2UJL6_SALR5|nr:uncharacterized protein PTSG_08410 [Salpingoeca rosetta]EGD77315.1 hypothetical protein PTSG_08410 [Salpingoeca rosetta]|eukprot:XP_004990659.1 hypothetical protein PTSG_08410 [Salpingoeca rosetta]